MKPGLCINSSINYNTVSTNKTVQNMSKIDMILAATSLAKTQWSLILNVRNLKKT